jgi:acyl carrier protein
MENMTRDEIRARVTEIVSECGEIPAEELEPEALLSRYGIDSLAGVNIAYEIGILTGRTVPPELLTQHGTIEALVGYILS